MRERRNRRGVTPPLILGLVGVIVIVLGLGTGVAGLSVVPTSSTAPSLHAFMYYVNATGYNVTTHTQIKANPSGSMIVTKVAINWGGTIVSYTAGSLLTANTGTFGFYRYHVLPSVAGPVQVSAVVTAIDGKSTYTATTAVTTVTLPGGTTACSHLCPDVSSAFTVSESGLAVTFTDASQILNSTTTTYSWTFGDGLTGAGSPVVHSYAVAGTYLVTETVSILNATGAGASSTSSQNVTVVATGPGPGCQGTASCSTPIVPFLTGTSGLIIGAGVGLVAWAALWGRPELGVLALVAATAGGFVIGMLNTGAWVL
jgi:PKD repeat protein